MRIDAAPPIISDLIRGSSFSAAPSAQDALTFEDLISSKPQAEQSRAYSFSELGWAGHAGASGAAQTPSVLLAQSSPARSRAPGADRQIDQAQSDPAQLAHPSAAPIRAPTKTLVSDTARELKASATDAKPALSLSRSPVLTSASSSSAASTASAGALATSMDDAAVQAEFVAEVISQADPIAPIHGGATTTSTRAQAPVIDIDQPLGASPPEASREPAPQRASIDSGGGDDISVIVSQQAGATQVVASAPELGLVAAARLRKAAEGVAAELGVTLSEFSINGAALPEAPISMIGAWNGRHTG